MYIYSLFHFRYPVMTIESGIIILNENLKAIQLIFQKNCQKP